MSKQHDLKYIKGFSKINIASICEELKVDKANLLAGRTSEKTTEAVKLKIQEKLKELDN